jgi:hypothetical protein
MDNAQNCESYINMPLMWHHCNLYMHISLAGYFANSAGLFNICTDFTWLPMNNEPTWITFLFCVNSVEWKNWWGKINPNAF